MKSAVRITAGFALGALVGGVVHAADDSASARPEIERVARLTRNVEQLNAAIARESDRIPLYSQRGDSQLFLGRFKEAVADFEKMIELDPAQDAPHWRLGIAYYFAGNFGKSARQFEKYHSYDGRDRENGIWKFLAQARDAGLEKARAEMLSYTQFDREPFPSLYEMFAGRKTSDELFQEIERKNLQENRLVIFFANYYAGVHEALLGRHEVAADHLRKAVALFDEERANGGPGYMWQVARLHYEEIRRAAAKR